MAYYNQIWGNNKPPQDCRIDYSHPILRRRKLIACLLINELGGNLIDLANPGNSLPIVNAGKRQFNAGGPWLDSTGGNDAGAAGPGWGPLVAAVTNADTHTRTVMWRGTVNTGSSAGNTIAGLMFGNTDTSPFVCYAIQFGASPNSQYRVAWNSGGVASNFDAASPIGFSGQERVVTATWDQGSEVLYENGAVVTTSGGNTGWNYGTTPRFGIGVYFNGDNLACKIITRHCLVFADVLNLAEVQWLVAEPFAFIARPRPIVRVIPAAGGAAIVGGMRANSILGGGVYVA